LIAASSADGGADDDEHPASKIVTANEMITIPLLPIPRTFEVGLLKLFIQIMYQRQFCANTPFLTRPNCAKALVVGDGSETKLKPKSFLADHVIVA